MPRGKRRFTYYAVSLAMALLWGQAALAQGPVLLELKNQAGDVNQYEITLSSASEVTSGGGNYETSNDVRMLMRWEVKKIGPEGVMDVSVSIVEGDGTINGEPVELPNVGDTKMMKISKRGTILDVTPDNNLTFDGEKIDYQPIQVEFSAKPLSIGDSWTKDVTAGSEEASPMEATYTLTGFEEVNGYQCAVIDSKITLLPERQPPRLPYAEHTTNLEASGRLYFAYQEGRVVKNELQSRLDMTMQIDADDATEPENATLKMSSKLVMELK